MPKLATKRGTTAKVIRVFIQDTSKTDGSGLTGLVYNTSGLTAVYTREGDSAATVITLVTATAGTWVSGGFVAVDGTNFPGLYELGLPNLALASGQSVQVLLRGAANMATTAAEVELDAVDNQDAVRYGLSALPASAPNTAGGSRSPILASGTAQGGTSTTIILAAGDTGTAGAYIGCLLQITGGTGVGETRTIAGYNAGTKTVTLATGRTYSPAPDITSTYIIVADAHPALNDALQVVAGLASTDATAIRVALSLPAAAPNANGGVATIGETGALLDATDIAAIWAAVTSGMTTTGSVGLLLKTALNALNAPGTAGGMPVLGETAALLDAVDLLAIAQKLLANANTPLNNNASTGNVNIDLTQRYDQATYVKGSLGHWFRKGWARLFGKSIGTPAQNKIDYYRTDDLTIEYTDFFDNITTPGSRNTGGTT